MQGYLSRKTAHLTTLALIAVAISTATACGGGNAAASPTPGNTVAPILQPTNPTSPPTNPTPAVGPFTPTGNMTIARADHWATLLA